MLASQEGPCIRAPGKKELPSSSIGMQIPVSKLWVDFHITELTTIKILNQLDTSGTCMGKCPLTEG